MKSILAQHGKKILLILLFLCSYLICASVQAFNVNTDMFKADQIDNMSRAVGFKTEPYNYISDGNRMPVYPYLLSFLYHSNIPMEDYFQRENI